MYDALILCAFDTYIKR